MKQVTKSDERGEKKNHSANRELATALFNREDHYFFKATQQKAVEYTPFKNLCSYST